MSIQPERDHLMKRMNILKIAIAAVMLAALGAAVYAQDKYSLKSPSGIAFSDFKGYEASGQWSPPPGPMKCSRSSSPTRR